MKSELDGWAAGCLADVVASIRSGVSVNSEDRAAVAGELGVLKTSCVTTGVFRASEHKAVVAADLHRVAEPVTADTVIVSRMNTLGLVGASGYVPASYPNLFLPDRLWAVRAAAGVCPRWLAYVIADPRMRARLKSAASGTSGSMKNLSQDSFLALPVDIPPLPEQRRIAAVLGAWDQAIAQTERLIAAQRLARDAESQRALAPAFRGSKGGWTQRVLGWAFAERDEHDPELPLASITANEGVIDRELVERRDTSSEDKASYKVIRPGDIGYNTMRMWQGVSGLSALNAIVSPAYTVVVPVSTRIDAEFAAHLFKAPQMVNRFWRYSQGLVDDTLQLKFKHFAEIEVALPTIEEQRRIAAKLNAGRTELDLLNRLAANFRLQKRGLMHKLLTGERQLLAHISESEVAA